MTMENLLRLLNEVIITKGDYKIEKIEWNTSLRNDLGFDSMDLAVLTAKIEDEFDVDIFENGIVDTVKEIIEKVR